MDPLWAEITTVPCRYRLPSGHVEGQSVACADVRLFEDEPGGATVTLHIARFRAGTTASPTATFYLQGGPGAHAQSELSTLTPERLRTFTTAGDYIVFDQRGAGASRPALECDAAARATTGPDRIRALEACLADVRATGVRTHAYDSEHIARDVEAMRKALGLSQVNLVARSYGTRVALEVLRRYERSVRAVVLDAPVPPDLPTWAEQARSFEQGLRALASECAQTPRCAERYPSLDAQVLTAAEQLDAAPLRVELGAATLSLDGALLLGVLGLALYRRETYPALPLFIDAARRRDTAVIGAVLREFVSAATLANNGASLAMNHVVLCNDSAQYFDDEAVARAESGVHPRVREHFSSLYVSVVRQVCRSSRPVARSGVTERVRSAVPTLVLTGAIDPVVPPSYATHVQETLSRATTLTFARVGHGAIETPCGSGITAQFLATPEATVDGACAQATPAIEFR